MQRCSMCVGLVVFGDHLAGQLGIVRLERSHSPVHH
jgi:hypothetical protein